MKRFNVFICMILIFSVFSYSSDLKDIKENGIIKVGICSIPTPPFFYRDENNRLTGIDIQIVDELAKRLSVKYEFVFAPTFDEVIQDLVENRTDIAVSNISITLKRAEKVLYTQPYFKLKMGAFIDQLILDKVRKKDGTYNLNKKGIKIGVLKDSSYEGFAKQKFPLAKIMTFKTWDEVMKNMDNKNIHISFYDEVAIKRTIRKNPEINIKYKNITIHDQIDPIAIAVNPERKFLFEWVKHFLDMYSVNQSIDYHIDEYMAVLNKINSTATNIPEKKEEKVSNVKHYVSIVIIIAGIFYFWKKKGTGLRNRFISFMLNPWTVLAGLTGGILYGFFVKINNIYLFGIGDIYLTLLKMCSIPIMMTALITSLGKLFRSEEAASHVKKIIIYILLFLTMASILGVFGSMIGGPGKGLSEKSKQALGNTASISQVEHREEGNKVERFIKRFIPSNIFTALSKGDVLGVLFFSIILGVSLGFIDKSSGDEIFSVLDALFNSLIQIISWTIYILPVALFSLLAKQVTNMGPQIMVAMGKFVIIFYIICVVLCIFFLYVIAKKMKMDFLKVVSYLKNTILIAFGTSNSYAAMPVAMRSLEEKFSVDKKTVKLVLPLGITVCRPGTMLAIAVGTVFIAQIFDVSLLIGGKWFIAIIGVVVAGIAGAGSPAAIAVSMLSIFFPFLGLPVEIALILLFAVIPVIDPIGTLLNVLSSVALTSMIKQEE